MLPPIFHKVVIQPLVLNHQVTFGDGGSERLKDHITETSI
jgi:hypothetical protein